MMCDAADGTNDVEQTKRRRARKPHICEGCKETIKPGDTYAVTSVLYDSSWFWWKHCLRCDAMFSHLLEKARGAYDELAVDPGLDCGEDYEHAWGEPPPADVAALAFALPKDFPGAAGTRR